MKVAAIRQPGLMLSGRSSDSSLRDGIDGVTYCSLTQLAKQKVHARLLRFGSREIHAQQSGQHLSVRKGRGMDFTESRAYQAGDDVRFLDWRVTARTGKLHTKLYAEERERPVLLIVDLRAGLFFGTRRCFKSVLVAELASLLLWKNCQAGDKTGGVILTATGEQKSYRPQRSQAAAGRFIQGVSRATQTSQTATDGLALVDALQSVRSFIETGTQCILISDFQSPADLQQQASPLQTRLSALAAQTALVLVAVHDPFEEQLVQYPEPLELHQGGHFQRLTGRLQQRFQQDYERWQATRRQLLDRQAQHPGSRLIEFSTAEDPAQRLVKLSQGMR